MVFQRIGIHLQEFMAKEGLVFVWNLNFVQLPLQVSFEVFLVFRPVVAGEAAGAAEEVVRHVIAGIEAVVGVDFSVDNRRHGRKEGVLVHRGVECLELVVDEITDSEMDASFVSQDTRFHIEEVVVLCFLVSRVIALQLELLRFQIIARVVFVGNRNRDDVQCREIADDVLFARHVEHLEDAGLRAVVRILRASFALGNPDRLVCFLDRVVDVS